MSTRAGMAVAAALAAGALGGCGSCHTLAAAGTTGTAGPSLDGRDYDVPAVEGWVRRGGKGMPAYAEQLSAQQIRNVATFLAASGRTP